MALLATFRRHPLAVTALAAGWILACAPALAVIPEDLPADATPATAADETPTTDTTTTDAAEEDSAATDTAATDTVAPETVAPETVAPETAARETVATETAAPDASATGTTVSDIAATEAPTSGTSAPAAPPAASTTPAAQIAPAAPVAKPVPPKKPVLVPGTGVVVKGSGDDFENEKWNWFYNHPKSSEEQDKRMRSPMGRSHDGLWFEGPKRGTPDVVKRIPLPAPGIEGSAHGLLIASLRAGIPGRVTYKMQQDDLVFNLGRATGNGMSVADNPSVVVRVYLPPFEQWENRTGPSFGFRAGCFTHAIITGDDHPREGRFGLEEYWPGMFISFESSHAGKFKEDSAHFRIRGGRNGGEIRGPKITELGWWTLGMSFSRDGMVHYFASPGVDALTMDDHMTSQFPYGYRTETFKTYFFNVCTHDDGKTWSTPWVIDDPRVYYVKRQQMATTSTKRR